LEELTVDAEDFNETVENLSSIQRLGLVFKEILAKGQVFEEKHRILRNSNL
jgi:hypothetical protein